MGKSVVKQGVVCLGGYDLTGDTNAIAASYGAQALDGTVLGDNTRNYGGGLKTTKFVNKGFWDATADAGIFDDISLTDVLTFGFGSAEGDVVFFQQAMAAQYQTGDQVGKYLPFSLTAEAAGDLIRGTLAANKTGITTTGSGTSFQLGAVSSSQKVYAALHVTDIQGTGTPTLAAILQSSPDGTSWTDRITFTDATAIGAQFDSLAGAITDTYWRITYTITGTTPSFDFVVAVGIQ